MATVIQQPRDTRYGDIGAGILQAVKDITEAKVQREEDNATSLVLQNAMEAEDWTEATSIVMETAPGSLLGNKSIMELIGGSIDARFADSKPINKTDIARMETALFTVMARIKGQKDVAGAGAKSAEEIARENRESREAVAKADRESKEGIVDVQEGGKGARQQVDIQSLPARKINLKGPAGDIISLDRIKQKDAITSLTSARYVEVMPATEQTVITQEGETLTKANITKFQEKFAALDGVEEKLNFVNTELKKGKGTAGITGAIKVAVSGIIGQTFSAVGLDTVGRKVASFVASEGIINARQVAMQLRTELLPFMSGGEKGKFSDPDVERINQILTVLTASADDRESILAINNILEVVRRNKKNIRIRLESKNIFIDEGKSDFEKYLKENPIPGLES